jgi:hypothetical protein
MDQQQIVRPPHALAALTTYELAGYRRELEHAITFFDKQDPVPPARGMLQAELDGILAEQADRARISQANGGA